MTVPKQAGAGSSQTNDSYVGSGDFSASDSSTSSTGSSNSSMISSMNANGDSSSQPVRRRIGRQGLEVSPHKR